MGDHVCAILAADCKHQARLGQRQLQPVWTGTIVIDRPETVFLDEVEDRHRPLVLDIWRRTSNRFVELDVDKLVAVLEVAGHRYMFSLIATERACASSPSALASAMAAGSSALSCSGPGCRFDVLSTNTRWDEH